MLKQKLFLEFRNSNNNAKPLCVILQNLHLRQKLDADSDSTELLLFTGGFFYKLVIFLWFWVFFSCFLGPEK